MDYDYNFGNDYYKYYGSTGIKSTIYNTLAPEQEQDVLKVTPSIPYFKLPNVNPITNPSG